jgi:predicted small lipoprotein YifL
VIRLLMVFLIAAALGAGVSSCGKKGDLQPPPDKKEERRS